jgi:diguanylate cyclase (GGDEF)-like protein
MSSALLPPDEDDRLATLAAYGVLDTAADVRFDRIVQLAAEHFDAPISLLSFVDANRQWFKATSGLQVREAPRAHAFCAHAILTPDDVMVVENAASDPRFCDNVLVAGDAHIRFYAGAPLRAENGQPLGTLCILDRKPRILPPSGRRQLLNIAAGASTVMELHRRTLLQQQSATQDLLTGLSNRRQFEAALAASMEGALGGRSFGVLSVDLDGFKQINQAIGDAGGDALLQDVGRRLAACMRGCDVVARLDGDKFAVIVAGPVELDTAHAVARRVMAALGPPHVSIGRNIPIRASIGIALAPLHACSAADVMRAADEAVFAAKRAGRNQTMVAEPAVRRGRVATGHAPTLEEDLARAVEADALTLHWQPYFNVQTGRVAGHEALARWARPGYGPVPPSTFIPVAEGSNLIGALDACVLRMACMQARERAPELTISVNISPFSLAHGELVTLVQTTLASTGFPAERLVIELTERTLVEHPEAALERIRALNNLGVRLALDDFGTGYSSLAYLRQFPFDCVKLDRSFVAGLGSDVRAEAVALAILQLGRALEMQVCAEGVETELQYRFLANAHCDLVQGFLLGRPLPSPQMQDARILSGGLLAEATALVRH